MEFSEQHIPDWCNKSYYLCCRPNDFSWIIYRAQVFPECWRKQIRHLGNWVAGGCRPWKSLTCKHLNPVFSSSRLSSSRWPTQADFQWRGYMTKLLHPCTEHVCNFLNSISSRWKPALNLAHCYNSLIEREWDILYHMRVEWHQYSAQSASHTCTLHNIWWLLKHPWSKHLWVISIWRCSQLSTLSTNY